MRLRFFGVLALSLGCHRPRPTPVVAHPPAHVAPKVESAAPKPSAIPDNGWTERERASHALARLAFGPRPGDVDRVATLGVERWIRAQLTKAPSMAVPLPSSTMSIGDLADAYPKPGGPQRLAREVAAAKLIRAAHSERQLEEVLVDFWFNHFNVDESKGAVKWMIAPYERDAIRAHVFGNFRDLLGATAKHPAMLFYLDNWLSTVDRGGKAKGKKKGHGLNENYARELLELHTLGVDGGYTQDDVREVARAFTGWTLERLPRSGMSERPRADAEFVFRPALHEPGDKSVLGATITDGGVDEGERILDLLATHPSTARFLATKLARRFVADDPPKELIDRVAEAFRASKGDLVATYEALFFSKELWSDAARRSKVKDPFELAVSAIRAIDGVVERDAPKRVEPLARATAGMGLALYRCGPPTGYREVATAWVGSGALVARIRFGLALAEGRFAGVTYDPKHLAEGALNGDAGALLDRVAGTLLGAPLAPATRAAIVKELDGDPADDEAARRRLVHAIALVLGSPDFQRQ